MGNFYLLHRMRSRVLTWVHAHAISDGLSKAILHYDVIQERPKNSANSGARPFFPFFFSFLFLLTFFPRFDSATWPTFDSCAKGFLFFFSFFLFSFFLPFCFLILVSLSVETSYVENL